MKKTAYTILAIALFITTCNIAMGLMHAVADDIRIAIGG